MKFQPKLIISEEQGLENAQKFLLNNFKINVSANSIQISIADKDSIGISDIVPIFEWAYLKKSEPATALILEGEKLTIEAQNSLLKLLEEPPTNIFIAIFARNSELFLPTILSRTELTVLKATSSVSNLAADSFLKANLLERFKIIDMMLLEERSRQIGLELIEELLRLIDKTVENLARFETLKLAYKGIKKRGNIKQIMEFVALNI